MSQPRVKLHIVEGHCRGLFAKWSEPMKSLSSAMSLMLEKENIDSQVEVGFKQGYLTFMEDVFELVTELNGSGMSEIYVANFLKMVDERIPQPVCDFRSVHDWARLQGYVTARLALITQFGSMV